MADRDTIVLEWVARNHYTDWVGAGAPGVLIPLRGVIDALRADKWIDGYTRRRELKRSIGC